MKIIRFLGVSGLLLLLTASFSATAFAATADDATYQITAGDPAANPKVIKISTGTDVYTSTVHFDIALSYEDEAGAEEDADSAKTQVITVSAGANGIITNISGPGGINATPNSETYSVTLEEENANAQGGLDVTVKYTDYGHKTVSVSGTVTFEDDSTLSDDASAPVTAIKLVIQYISPRTSGYVDYSSPAPIPLLIT